MWSNPGSIPLTASGVQYRFWENNTYRYFALARREVIIAAGAIQVKLLH
jgi:hypothetical protein